MVRYVGSVHCVQKPVVVLMAMAQSLHFNIVMALAMRCLGHFSVSFHFIPYCVM